MAMTTTPWRGLGDAVVARYARSWWRLPVVVVVTTVVLGLPLYLLRGPRLLRLGLLGVVGLVGAGFCFAHPFQTLLAALLISYSGLPFLLPGPIIAALSAVTLARCAFDALAGRPVALGSRVSQYALAILLASVLTSLLVVQDWGRAGAQLTLIATGLALWFVVAQLCDRASRVLALCIAIATGIALATLWLVRGLVAGGGTGLLQLAAGVRLGGLGTDPNVQAAYAVAMLAPVVLGAVIVRGRAARTGLALTALLLVCCVVLTQSRAGMLVQGAVLVWLVLRARRGRLYAVIALAAAAVVALMLPQVYWVRFESILQFNGIVVDRSLQLRQHAMQGAWATFVAHPWTGVGVGNLSHHAASFMLGTYLAHNTVLEVAAGIGLVGTLGWLTWYASGIHMAWNAGRRWRAAGRRSEAVIAEAVAIGQVALFAAMLFLSMPFFLIVWVMVAFGVALHHACNRDLSA
jgi:hypothetical protein